jgi:hypothetical protein
VNYRADERELAERVLAPLAGEYDPSIAAAELAVMLQELAETDSTYGLELFGRRALALINEVERSLAPRHDGQQMLFDEAAILQLGDGRSVRLGHVDDPAQLDRAHAIRTRQHAGQVVAYAAWTTSYIDWREQMVSSGLPLRDALDRGEPS